MTETTNKPDRRRFGGYICNMDFDYIPRESNEENGSFIALRIANDMLLDDKFRKNIEKRKEQDNGNGKQ